MVQNFGTPTAPGIGLAGPPAVDCVPSWTHGGKSNARFVVAHATRSAGPPAFACVPSWTHMWEDNTRLAISRAVGGPSARGAFRGALTR